MIIFKGSAVLQPRPETIDQAINDPYLPSGVHLPENLLEPLSLDSRPGESKPALSASRLRYGVERPKIDTSLKAQPLTIHVPDAFPALPAISSRVRYHRSVDPASKCTLVVALDIEIAPFSQEEIELTNVAMRLSGGSIADLGQGRDPKLPLQCKPRDGLVFLYSLTPDSFTTESAISTSRTLEIIINATVLVSEVCRPTIQMHWKTKVDFSSVLNPAFGVPGQSIQRSIGPPSVLVASSSAHINSTPHLLPEAYMGHDTAHARQSAISTGELGITITFTAPRTVNVQKAFAWDIMVTNGSSKPRRLEISADLKQGQGIIEGNPSRPSLPSADGPKRREVADAVMDKQVLHALQRTVISEPSSIISVSANVGTG
ncbi:MAG: hypothetical protein Q9163_000764 [Psora crenata]